MNKNVAFQITRAKNNDVTVLASIEGKTPILLHSMVNPRNEAEDWVKRIDLQPDTLYIILGAGLGYHVRALLDRLPHNSFIMLLYTQEELALLKYVSDMPGSRWLSDKRLHTLQLINLYDMSVVIGDAMIDMVVKKINLCRHFPSMKLAKNEYRQIEVELVSQIENSMMMNFNVQYTTNYKFFENYWRNFSSIVTSPGTQYLENLFADVPVIVVAGGPSLNKNIEELKQCMDKAVVIAAGTTLGALHYHGITPHFLVVTDANDLMYDTIKHCLSPKTILVAVTTTQYRLIANYPGMKLFLTPSIDFAGELEQFLPANLKVRQTISVATAAVDFANICAAKRIILIGQDLAFGSANQQHADGVHQQAGAYEKWKRIKVEGYYGTEVETVSQFQAVIEYYNQYVLENRHIDFINATEGGALIKSMRNLPLNEVHSQFLKEDIGFDTFYAMALEHKGESVDYSEIIKLLYRMNKQCEKLNTVINEFHKRNSPSLADQNQEEGLEAQVNAFAQLYNTVTTHKAYSYIKSVMDFRIGFLKFQIQDQMPLQLQYAYYTNMTSGLQEILSNLIAWTKQNIVELKRIYAEVAYEKQK